MLHFVKNFTEDRTFKVIITKSEKMTSVRLFLIVISEMLTILKNHATKDLDQDEIKPYAWTKKKCEHER
jgi:hypothetical protein